MKKTIEIKYWRYVVKAIFPSNPYNTYTYGKYKTEAQAQEKAYEVANHIDRGVRAWVEKKQCIFFKEV